MIPHLLIICRPKTKCCDKTGYTCSENCGRDNHTKTSRSRWAIRHNFHSTNSIPYLEMEMNFPQEKSSSVPKLFLLWVWWGDEYRNIEANKISHIFPIVFRWNIIYYEHVFLSLLQEYFIKYSFEWHKNFCAHCLSFGTLSWQTECNSHFFLDFFSNTHNKSNQFDLWRKNVTEAQINCNFL